MSENVEILKSIRSSLARFRAETNARLDPLESGMRKGRRNVAGMLAMMRARAGDFEPRVTDIEARAAALEVRA